MLSTTCTKEVIVVGKKTLKGKVGRYNAKLQQFQFFFSEMAFALQK